jgi:hypothetical protein
MKKLLGLFGLAALFASPAYAGFGATAHLGGTSDGTTWAPSLDYRGGGWLVQIHAIDLIGQLPNKYVDLGVDVSGVAMKRKVAEDIEGVLMPGVSLQLYSPTSFSSPGFHAVAETRLGAEIKQKMGFGMYVVPQLGVSNLTGKMGVTYGGSLQVSAWFRK